MNDRLLTIADHRRAYAEGTSVAAVVADLRRRVKAVADDAIFIGGLAGDLDEQAATLDALPGGRNLPLFGIPVAVKDNIDVAGLATTAACPDFSFMPTRSAPAIARLAAAGALIVGKANLDQFATGLVGTRSPYGTPNNALDPALVPGGSSSGSAVAVARGLVPLAMGTDTAGSGRVPAAMNQVVGLKPTRGLVSNVGVQPACRSLDCVSIFARSVADAHMAFQLVAADDQDDPWSRPDRYQRPLLRLDRTVIGIAESCYLEEIDPGIASSFERMVARLTARGASVELVEIGPFLAAGSMLYDGPYLAERFAAVGDFLEKSPGSLLEVTRSIIAEGAQWSAADYHLAADRICQLRADAARLWSRVDVVALPTVPLVPSLVQVRDEPIATNAALGRFTTFTNLLDLAALTVPDPTDRRPGRGVTLHAPARCDARLAGWAAALEDDGVLVVAGSCVDVVIAGAHLEGQSRNLELQALGATLVGGARTAPHYRLWALPDGERPALERLADGGASIDVEIWSLDRFALGSLVAGVSAPLAIGRVDLDDGSSRTGFVVESGGWLDATDITHYGGWRQWQAR